MLNAPASRDFNVDSLLCKAIKQTRIVTTHVYYYNCSMQAIKSELLTIRHDNEFNVINSIVLIIMHTTNITSIYRMKIIMILQLSTNIINRHTIL
jgi:hypothetical protein